MEYDIYLDESGNTGNIQLNNDLTWNFKEQKNFALGAIYWPKEQSEIIRQNILSIMHKYDPKLGTENELKSKAKYKFKNSLLKDLLKMLMENKARFYFDIADKKYKVIMNIVEYCVYPYYIFGLSQNRDLKIDIANVLYKILPLEYIKQFMDLCSIPKPDDNTVTHLTEFMITLKEHLYKNRIKNNPIDDQICDYVKNYKQHGLQIENLFPVKDINNKGIGESFLPNVDAYNNIIGSIKNLRLNASDTINIYHDEQKQFSNTLTDWTKILEDFQIESKLLQFVVSKQNIFIQVADFFTGAIVRLHKEILGKAYLDRSTKEFIKELEPIFSSCNIVASQYNQDRFFKACKLKCYKTTTPFDRYL